MVLSQTTSLNRSTCAGLSVLANDSARPIKGSIERFILYSKPWRSLTRRSIVGASFNPFCEAISAKAFNGRRDNMKLRKLPPTVFFKNSCTLSARSGVIPGSASIATPRRSNTGPAVPALAEANNAPASRNSGAGDMIAAIIRSASSKADSSGLFSKPIMRRKKLETARANLSHAVYLPPLGLIDFKRPTNSGFDCASAANSSRLVEPYAVPKESLIKSNNCCS